MLTKDLAICLRTVDYSETSQIVTLFTKSNGKIDAIAKGSKRPKSAFDGPLEVFSFGRIIFSDSNKEKLVTLTEFEQQPTFTRFCNDLFVLNCASFATELLTHLTNEHDPHPDLFESFLQFLQNLQDTKDNSEVLALLILFQLTLLNEAGLKPILNACVNCKTNFNTNWLQVYFSSSANGLICRDCEHAFPDRIKLTKPIINTLADLKKIADTDENTLFGIEKVLIHHFTETLGRRPKLAKYIIKN
ncbi:MAG: DNA repair protein RecO [Planctomycetes bacterium]|nr:DNA repair protein RecO [Planctomycetota bacterium]